MTLPTFKDPQTPPRPSEHHDACREARIVTLIRTVALRGAGIKSDPVREVVELWETDGTKVAEVDGCAGHAYDASEYCDYEDCDQTPHWRSVKGEFFCREHVEGHGETLGDLQGTRGEVDALRAQLDEERRKREEAEVCAKRTESEHRAWLHDLLNEAGIIDGVSLYRVQCLISDRDTERRQRKELQRRVEEARASALVAKGCFELHDEVGAYAATLRALETFSLPQATTDQGAGEAEGGVKA